MMKRSYCFILTMLVVLLSVTACSEDDSMVNIQGKQYIYQNDTSTFCIHFPSVMTAEMDVYHGNRLSNHCTRCKITGDYPTIKLEFPDDKGIKTQFSMVCSFRDRYSFDATVCENDLQSIYINNLYKVKAPEKMQFRAYYGILDMNRDFLMDDQPVIIIIQR